MNKITTKVVVSLQVEGVHCWADCPIEDVLFLRDPHRHMFHIKATKVVSHDDRDVEIIMLKRAMKHNLLVLYSDKTKAALSIEEPLFFGTMSCEMIARHLLEKFELSSCEVLEDGENGAILEAE